MDESVIGVLLILIMDATILACGWAYGLIGNGKGVLFVSIVLITSFAMLIFAMVGSYGMMFLIGIIGGIVVLVLWVKQMLNNRKNWHQGYINALTALRLDPTNSGFRMKALRAGREYLATHRPKVD
jgi:hypothetical protein